MINVVRHFKSLVPRLFKLHISDEDFQFACMLASKAHSISSVRSIYQWSQATIISTFWTARSSPKWLDVVQIPRARILFIHSLEKGCKMRLFQRFSTRFLKIIPRKLLFLLVVFGSRIESKPSQCECVWAVAPKIHFVDTSYREN